MTAITAQVGVETAAVPLDYAEMVRLHQATVFSIGYHFLHDRDLAEELAQDVFLQLHRHLAELKSPEHVAFWLRKVASHRAIDCARRRKFQPKVGLDDAPEPVAATAEGDLMLSERLRRLVASLPEKLRIVVILRYQEDLDPTEIAGVLDIPVRTVKGHLQRAVALLREKLSNTIGDESL